MLISYYDVTESQFTNTWKEHVLTNNLGYRSEQYFLKAYSQYYHESDMLFAKAEQSTVFDNDHLYYEIIQHIDIGFMDSIKLLELCQNTAIQLKEDIQKNGLTIES